MKIKKATIPTPPKGFQTMFHVWLVSWELQNGDGAYFFHSPTECILGDDLMYVDDNDRIHQVSHDSHTIYTTGEDWADCIETKIWELNEDAESVIYDLDHTAIALEFPSMANGVRWHIIGNPDIALKVLSFKEILTKSEEFIFMALFEMHFPQAKVMFQALESGASIVKNCQWHSAHNVSSYAG